MQRTGGQALASALRSASVRTVFSVSGNQVLPFFDAAGDYGIGIIHMRHESAAAFAAAGFAEMSGEPGVILTSAGPAFLAALTGVAAVRAMELPLIFLSGAHPRANSGFGTFQELDQAVTCSQICKVSLLAKTVESIPDLVNEAWRLSQSGIPGPVHIALHADVMLATGEVRGEGNTPVRSSPSHDVHSLLEAVATHLRRAVRPVVIARPAAARGRAGDLLKRLAQQLGVHPVITGPPRGLADSKYAHLTAHYKRSDCALVIGPSDYSLGFLDESVIAAQGEILLMDAEGDPKPRRRPAVHVQTPTLEALSYLVEATSTYEPRDPEWVRLWQLAIAPEPLPASDSGAMHPLHVAAAIREFLQPDDVLVVDGGEFCQWMRLGFRDVENRWLWNSKFGIIGNSLPMALGVSAFGHSGRTVAIMGDGGAGYHLLEFETAVRHGIPFVGIIGNDARWGAEWHLQELRYGPDRTFDTTLLPARYDQSAIGLGALGFHAATTEELREALATAMASRKPACINVSIQSLRSPAAPP